MWDSILVLYLWVENASNQSNTINVPTKKYYVYMFINFHWGRNEIFLGEDLLGPQGLLGPLGDGLMWTASANADCGCHFYSPFF